MRRQKRSCSVRAGYTLMEMTVVVAIILILVAISVPIYMTRLDDAKKDSAQVNIRTLAQSAEIYKQKYGDYPPNLTVLAQPAPDGATPSLSPRDLFDPWGHSYEYVPQGPHNAPMGKPDIWSAGPNVGDPDGVIGNW